MIVGGITGLILYNEQKIKGYNVVLHNRDTTNVEEEDSISNNDVQILYLFLKYI